MTGALSLALLGMALIGWSPASRLVAYRRWHHAGAASATTEAPIAAAPARRSPAEELDPLMRGIRATAATYDAA